MGKHDCLDGFPQTLKGRLSVVGCVIDPRRSSAEFFEAEPVGQTDDVDAIPEVGDAHHPDHGGGYGTRLT